MDFVSCCTEGQGKEIKSSVAFSFILFKYGFAFFVCILNLFLYPLPGY